VKNQSQQINFFKEKGFIKLKEFYKNKEILSFEKEINKLKQSKTNKIAKYYQSNIPKNKISLFRIEHFYTYSGKFRKLIDSKKVNDFIFKLTKKKYILFKEKINIKPPLSREDRLHQDVQGDWLKYSKDFITLLISIVKTHKKNGNLIFDMSGNNKDKMKGKTFKVLKINQLDRPKFKDMPTNRGDIFLFNGYIPHKSTKNLSNKSRDQIYITYCLSKDKKVRKKYFAEKLNNCPPNQKNKLKNFVFKN